ncbi:MAG TPA: cupin domain-containing protein [Anaerolineae bacterium]
MTIETRIEPGTTVRLAGIQFTYRLTGQQSEGKQAQVEVTAEPQIFFAPPHLHLNEDESMYVIEGDCLVQNGKDVFKASAGDSVFLPKGMPHAIANAGDTPARVLLTLTPAGMEPYFAELAEALPDAPPLPAAAFADVDGFMEQMAANPETVPIMATLGALWQKYGLQGARSAGAPAAQ